MDPLLPAFRRELRARAHHLHPVVSIGHHGLTPAVLHEADVALTAHELIKVRVFADDRDERGSLLKALCTALDCAGVQQIGKLLVLWRPRPDEPQVAKVSPAMKPALRKNASVAKKAPMRKSAFVAKEAAATRRRTAGPVGQPEPVVPRRRAPAGKAPPGVPRAAAPRRRRVPR
jgi:putative YhbY family RNA-binding protein